MKQGKAQEGDIILRYVYLLNRQREWCVKQ